MSEDVVLRVDALCKRFGALEVSRSISLQVRRGEVHALIGPNGAGKSTLIAQISGQLRPDSGRVWLGGADVTSWPVEKRARHGLGRTFQISRVFHSMSGEDNVLIARNAHDGLASPWRRFVTDASTAAARQQLARLNVDDGSHRTGAMGYGTVRQIELAMGLVREPDVLLLDEPLAGLAMQEAEAAVRFLGALRGRFGMLLIEHDMEAVFALADRISVLVSGAIVACGTPEEIKNNSVVRQAYLGEE